MPRRWRRGSRPAPPVRAGGSAAAARPDPAPLPAVVRVLDAGRLDRHPLGRPLRDPVHAHRRLRRVAAGDDAARDLGEPAAAGLGRRALARPVLIGSEGILGVITEAWMRVRPRPRVQAVVRGRVRRLRRRGRRRPRDRPVRPPPLQLPPARCARGRHDRRRLGREEPAGARLRVGRPPARRPVDVALEFARDHGGAAGRRSRAAASAATGDAVGAWRSAFLLAPYLRDTLVACGVLSETFETAITWDRFEEFHASAMEAVRAQSPRSASAPGGRRSAAGHLPLHPRLPRRPGAVLHGHRPGRPRRRGRAVGRDQGGGVGGGDRARRHDHPPPRRRPRPPPLVRPPASRPVRSSFTRAKRELDPAAILNPGVLIDPEK